MMTEKSKITRYRFTPTKISDFCTNRLQIQKYDFDEKRWTKMGDMPKPSTDGEEGFD